MAKRNVLSELIEGLHAMKAHREAKGTLRSFKLEFARSRKVQPKVIRDKGKKLCCLTKLF
jgi:hypothetical protein